MKKSNIALLAVAASVLMLSLTQCNNPSSAPQEATSSDSCRHAGLNVAYVDVDTLLTSYGTSPELTALMNTTRISINPLANPDGTYHRGDNTVQGSQRYNANYVDLNRNYPDPFNPAKAAIQQENQAIMDYFAAHQFLTLLERWQQVS